MGLAEDFTNLGEDIMGSFDTRVNFLGKNIVDTHRFLHNCRNQHKAMGRKLRHDLGTFVENLQDFVERQQSKFRKDHKAAHHTWERVCHAMANKRRNFQTSLKTAKQKAGRAR